MFKRILTTFLVFALSVVIFSGCNSAKPEKFDASQFVNECRILVPIAQYANVGERDFKLDFVKTVLDEFSKSDYYKNMTDEERFEALNQIGEVLETYSYGSVTDGFVWDFRVIKEEHSVTWTVKYHSDTCVMWMMPGY
ncbi:MAG: hypothetical protein IKE09_00580 [Clostridiales bacterium]|nr:hypothetical protein [Clostridiales bacterium]